MPTLLILPLGKNENHRTLFHPPPGTQPVWGLTEGNSAKKHLRPGTVCMFVKPGVTDVCPPEKPYQVLPCCAAVPHTTGAIAAIGIVDRVTHDPTGGTGDRVWDHRLSYHFGARRKVDMEPFTYVFTVRDFVLTPWWGKQPMKRFLGIKDSDRLLGARGLRLHRLHPVWSKLDCVWEDRVWEDDVWEDDVVCDEDGTDIDDDDEPLVFVRPSSRRNKREHDDDVVNVVDTHTDTDDDDDKPLVFVRPSSKRLKT
jgi:hypothetical protein